MSNQLFKIDIVKPDEEKFLEHTYILYFIKSSQIILFSLKMFFTI